MNVAQFEIKRILIDKFDSDELLKHSSEKKLTFLIRLSIGVISISDNEVKITIYLTLDSNDNEKAIAIISTIFTIEMDLWNRNLSKSKKSITFNKSFMHKLVGVAIGNTRGILYSQSIHNKEGKALIFSYIDPGSFIEKAVTLSFSKKIE